MVKAVLSDIDGTLVQSNWLHAAAWRDAFLIAGIPLDLEQIRRQIGKGGDELIPVFTPWWLRKHIEAPLKTYRKFVFQTAYMHQVQPFPKVRELFLRMKRAGLRTALASSAARDELQVYARLAHIDDLLDEGSSADDVDRSKPHPDVFETALKKLRLPAHHVLALGDTPYDAESACLAGIWTIGVTTGGWTRQELLDAGCLEVYEDVADLLHHYDQSALNQ
jgi:HAD superfamily hydrolase (TIGR01509 family)